MESGRSDVKCIVPTKDVTGKVIGSSLCFDINIKGVQLTAMVDSGSPTTTISRSLLHRIANKLGINSKPIPELYLCMEDQSYMLQQRPAYG